MKNELSLDDLEHVVGGFWPVLGAIGARMFGGQVLPNSFDPEHIASTADEKAARAPEENSGFANQKEYDDFMNGTSGMNSSESSDDGGSGYDGGGYDGGGGFDDGGGDDGGGGDE